MGFFDLKVKCSICENEVGLNRFQLSKDVWICPSCLKKLGGTRELIRLKEMEVEQIKEEINRNNNALEDFKATKKIGNYFFIDENSKEIAIPKATLTGKVKSMQIYQYEDIVDFELIEDGKSITKGGIGKSIAGGLLFGEVGAVVGGVTGSKKIKDVCSKLQVKITLNNLSNPSVYINFIETEFKKDSIIYKEAYREAQEVLSALQVICNQKEKNNQNNFVADEIKKFKELLDSGVITQEEFDRKKQELLK